MEVLALLDDEAVGLAAHAIDVDVPLLAAGHLSDPVDPNDPVRALEVVVFGELHLRDVEHLHVGLLGRDEEELLLVVAERAVVDHAVLGLHRRDHLVLLDVVLEDQVRHRIEHEVVTLALLPGGRGEAERAGERDDVEGADHGNTRSILDQSWTGAPQVLVHSGKFVRASGTCAGQ